MDAFDPNCPRCVAEHVHGTLTSNAPPAPCRRHILPDPKETLRKELTQCQYCFKSKGPDVALQRYGGCCTLQTCQRAAWKAHKPKCAINRAQNQRIGATGHRPTISEVGVRALGVLGDPTRAERDVLLIALRPRLDSQRIETAFWVTAASFAPLSYFPTADEMRGQLTLAADATRRSGMTGFWPDGSEPPSTTWEEWLKRRLNASLVV
ncbi:hypothetical protein DFH08DRAFT_882148 [Mycena albidolilacea]|uniref:MYND-type domain-containing protein n=1 Tax=Mycena albidolilacea TaxID=1033008 RepID=A0AAD6ZNK0_9AGAR|nr:hypothetical protein DFH08DRAFT_882148 [Mycena albidolilacea]